MAQGSNVLGCRDPIHVGHLNVEQGNVVGFGLDGCNGLYPVRDDIDLVPRRLQDSAGDLLIDRVVLRQEDPNDRSCRAHEVGG